MREKLSAVIGGVLTILGVLHYLMPLGYFFGKDCDVRFQAYLVSNYLDWSKQDRVVMPDLGPPTLAQPSDHWAFRNLRVIGRGERDTICFAGYRALKPSAGQAPPLESARPAVIVQADGDTFCVRKDGVASVRRGFLGWSGG